MPPRIQHLTLEETDALRVGVRARYGHALEENSYEANYHELREDIIRVLEPACPEVAQIVSSHRLRKLFYYANPARCPADQLQQPSFGRSFVTALAAYAEKEKDAILPPPPNLGWLRGLLLTAGIFLATLLLILGLRRPAPPDPLWEESFDSVSLETLQAHGWEVWDMDSAFFCRQSEPGAFTAYTLAGGYWVKDGESRVVKNLLVRKLPSTSCIVTMKIYGFNPQQRYQQAGFYLLPQDGDRSNFLLMTYLFEVFDPPATEGGRHIPGDYRISMILSRNGEISGTSLTGVNRDYGNPGLPLDTLYLRMLVYPDKCEFYLKNKYPWMPFLKIGAFEPVGFEPALVGVGAFHGYTDADRRPYAADTIPVYIDYVSAEALEQ